MTDERPEDDAPRSKVGRVIREYGLDGMGDRLERAWQGEGTERTSLRDLATTFNERVLESVMADAGLDPVDGEVENAYRLLTDDEASSGARTRVARRLEREDVDVDRLRKDFVSHQAIHTYLTEVRGVDHDAGEERDPVQRGIDTVQRLVGRLRSVTETTIGDLERADHVSIGEFDVVANVQVTCRDCGASYDVVTFLRRGSCECGD